MKTTKTFDALVVAIKAGKLENQNQQNHIFKILNGEDSEAKKLIKQLFESSDFEGLELSSDQIQKGKIWLDNLRFTPLGKERSTNPFGSREEYGLDNFENIYLSSIYDVSMVGYSGHYLPVYTVRSTERGGGFDYIVQGGIKIIG